MTISKIPPLQENQLQGIITTHENKFKNCEKIYQTFAVFKKLNKIPEYKNKFTVVKDQLGGSFNITNSITHYWINKEIIQNADLLKKKLDDIHSKSFNSSGVYYDVAMEQDVIIVFFEKQLAGMAIIDTDTEYLHDLCVYPNFRKKGLANILLKMAKKKFTRLWLNVEVNQEKVLCPYYKKRGFAQFKRGNYYISMRT